MRRLAAGSSVKWSLYICVITFITTCTYSLGKEHSPYNRYCFNLSVFFVLFILLNCMSHIEI
jgi:hypothetical protein